LGGPADKAVDDDDSKGKKVADSVKVDLGIMAKEVAGRLVVSAPFRETENAATLDSAVAAARTVKITVTFMFSLSVINTVVKVKE
jgi:hypothetical protein